MKLIINPVYTNIRRSVNYFLLSNILLLTVFILLPGVTPAQDKIYNEYRVTIVPTLPLSERLFLTTYLGYVNIPAHNRVNYYLGAPVLVTYRMSQVVEVMAGAFLVFSRLDGGKENTEFRPLAGVKLYVPNTNNMKIYNWTRYELRCFYYDDKSLNNVRHRLRNRIGLEFPLSKKAWQAKTIYALTDFEFFYTIDKGYFDRFRERLGIGYVFDRHWRTEMIYHIQMLKASEDKNPEWTNNIWRLNIKWQIPHKKRAPVNHPTDIDD